MISTFLEFIQKNIVRLLIAIGLVLSAREGVAWLIGIGAIIEGGYRLLMSDEGPAEENDTWMAVGRVLCIIGLIVIGYISRLMVFTVSLAGVYLLLEWLLGGQRPWSKHRRSAIAIGIQGITVLAGFYAASIWHLPNIGLLPYLWLGSFCAAWALVAVPTESQPVVLASAWAFIASQVFWVLLLWLVIYVMPGGYILIPQALIVILCLGYCYSGIYFAHRSGSLSRARLSEYGLVAVGLLIIVMLGTKWSGLV